MMQSSFQNSLPPTVLCFIFSYKLGCNTVPIKKIKFWHEVMWIIAIIIKKMLKCLNAAKAGCFARCCLDEDSAEVCSLTLLEQFWCDHVSNCQQHQSNKNPVIASWMFKTNWLTLVALSMKRCSLWQPNS